MEFGRADWLTFEEGTRKEWLLSNGIGGFSASTLTGANTRRYHGLLTASFKPPVQRHLVLSNLHESLELDGISHGIHSFSTGDYIMDGYKYLQRVSFNPLPVFVYSIGDTLIEKTIGMVYGENTTLLTYRVLNGASKARLRLIPLANFRDYHHTSQRWGMRFKQSLVENGTVLQPYELDTIIRLYSPNAEYIQYDDCWFEGMYYRIEQERGLDCREDHYIPGSFEASIMPWEDTTISFAVTTENNRSFVNIPDLLSQEADRISRLSSGMPVNDEFSRTLARAADHFIVQRTSTGSKTILAGYPWFTDWGRDTMIALPGLTLSTGRFKDAKNILSTFSKYVKHGLVPNMFPDEEQEPLYNSVDAALWYFEAIYKYISYTQNYDFVEKALYSSMKQIVSAFTQGTLYEIGVDKDGLVKAGNHHTQLTWMDAKVDSWVVTPRNGKAVEINALWYNALMVMIKLAGQFGEKTVFYEQAADKVKAAFTGTFWNEKDKCLFDVVNDGVGDDKVRPNQIIAVSLSHPVIEGEKAKAVVLKVWKELYTSYGLRSLSAKSAEFKGHYTGDRYSRDGAYHQGTVWTWPLGHFITAFKRVFGNKGKYADIINSFFEPFKDHFRDACVGGISEIFDAEEPFLPRGCFTQAWSVGEVLRAYLEE